MDNREIRYTEPQDGKTPGYICKQVGVDLTYFECVKVDDGAMFSTLRECQLICLRHDLGTPDYPADKPPTFGEIVK